MKSLKAYAKQNMKKRTNLICCKILYICIPVHRLVLCASLYVKVILDEYKGNDKICNNYKYLGIEPVV